MDFILSKIMHRSHIKSPPNSVLSGSFPNQSENNEKVIIKVKIIIFQVYSNLLKYINSYQFEDLFINKIKFFDSL